MREGALALGRLLGAPPGAWGLPGPGPGPQPSSDEPDSRGGWSLLTIPRASSASSLCCRPLMTLFSDSVSALCSHLLIFLNQEILTQKKAARRGGS